MTLVLPTVEPASVIAGDTWQWTKASSPDYPISDGWVLSYAFRGAAILDTQPTWITNDGALYTVSIPAASTLLAPGTYQLAGYLTLASVRHTVVSRSLVVQRNLATAVAGDLLSHYEKMIPILKAEIEARITGDGSGFESLSVTGSADGRAIGSIPIGELRRMLSEYSAAVAAGRANGRLGRDIHMHFRRTSR